jgi:hypothetical protein
MYLCMNIHTNMNMYIYICLYIYIGIERVLKLKMNWQQFDAMWNKLDSVRSGDLDMDEFKGRIRLHL